MSSLFVFRGTPEHIIYHNGSEFTAITIREWLARTAVKHSFEPSSARENGHMETFHAKLRGELLNRQTFITLPEAKALITDW
jgi:putative transposase